MRQEKSLLQNYHYCILLFFYGMLMYGKSKNLDVIGRISEIIIIISLLIYVLGYIGILKSFLQKHQQLIICTPKV